MPRSAGQDRSTVLLKGLLAAGISVEIEATGSSMRPTLQVGDVLRIEACDRNVLAPGDIVVFEDGDRLTAHRLTRRDPDGRLVTQGDAMDREDSPVGPERLLGRVIGVRRRGGVAALRRIFGRIHRPRGLISLAGSAQRLAIRLTSLWNRSPDRRRA